MSNLSTQFHEAFKDDMNPGNIIISSVIMSNALESSEKVGDNYLFVWSANAAEQIEAALSQMGYKLVKEPQDIYG